MPANLVNQIERMVSSKLNVANDVLPGQSVASGTGQAQYGGVRGNRVALGPDEIRFDSPTGTLFGGIYQYVLTASGAAAAPARGLAAFSDLSVAENLFQVTSDAKPTTAIPTLIQGVFLNAITKGNFGWIQIAGRASCLFDSAVSGAVAGNMVSAKVSAAVASTFDVGATVVTATTPTTVMAAVGVAETIPVVSTISVVQLFGILGFRRF